MQRRDVATLVHLIDLRADLTRDCVVKTLVDLANTDIDEFDSVMRRCQLDDGVKARLFSQFIDDNVTENILDRMLL